MRTDRDARGFLLRAHNRAKLLRLYRFLGDARETFHLGGDFGGFQRGNDVLGYIALMVGNVGVTARLDCDTFTVRHYPDPGPIGVR